MAKINYSGTNIVGAPFKDYVDQQIKIRQEKLGKLNKDNEDIVWQNAKSAYVALASSINIANSKYVKETLQFTPSTSDLTSGGQDTTGPASGVIDPALSGENRYYTELYASEYIDEKELEASSQNSFSSTVEIIERTDGEERVKLLELVGDPQDFFGNRLAREMVLYGGTSYYSEPLSPTTTPEFKFGITKNTNAFDKSIYGYGGTDEGLKPMPGITSFDIKSKNMGSLREATVTIRANSAEQFKMIDNLYCRIGYTMFIEWGNSLYFNNEGEYRYNETAHTLIPTFLSGKIKFQGQEEINLLESPKSFIDLIEQFRKFSDGNYDGFFGRVKNFSWEYIAKGQYYEITLSLISWGDIIESLTIDAQYGSTTGETKSGETSDNTSALATFLSTVAAPKGNEYILKNNEGEIKKRNFRPNIKNKIVYRTFLSNPRELKTQKNYISAIYDAGSTGESDTIPELSYTRLEDSIGKIVSSYAQFANKNYYYVRLGDILDFIKDKLLLYNPNSNNEPIMDIDTDTDKNIMYHSGINISADPTKVMVRARLPYNTDTLRGMIDDTEDEWTHFLNTDTIFDDEDAKLEPFLSKVDPNDSTQSFPLHGKIMNIYFEFGYLMETIKGLRDEKSTKIPLFDFLTKLCDTANSCLGGVNKLTVRLEDDRVIRIYDQNPIYGTQALEGEGTTINLLGFRPTLAFDEPGELVSNGSFVTDVSIKTQLTNEFSTTVSVGAQAQGQVVGEDATGLSMWNYGLVDRYYATKIDGLKKNKSQSEPTVQERVLKIRSQLKFLWLGYAEAKIELADLIPRKDDNQGPVPAERDDSWYKDAYKLVFKHFPLDKISDFVKLQKDFISEIIKLENDLRNSISLQKNENIYGTNQIGMIPINIQITIDGLSGIRIYDKLTLDTRFLPNYYPQTLYWIIKGVSHEIQNNKWYTKLETVAVPKIREEQDLRSMLNSEGLPINTKSFAREDVPDFISGDSGIVYTMAELTVTSQPYDNTPTPEVTEALQVLNAKILQPITNVFGKIGITSGYRSPAVNTAIGGSTTSQHMKGQAIDFTKVASGRPLSEVFEFIATKLDFDQAIWEKGDDGNPRWIHVSYNNTKIDAGQRKKLLRFFGNGRYVNCNAQGEI
jgi:zinc D-Ala-D-Ala carboxypeptidase